mmetsp:Transcript_84552/g.188931  ORF Transcript_84552/g.188931 Transcript_84552/m.188931 type:complete len:289 (-) Transcript_84552:146-1012(-)
MLGVQGENLPVEPAILADAHRAIEDNRHPVSSCWPREVRSAPGRENLHRELAGVEKGDGRAAPTILVQRKNPAARHRRKFLCRSWHFDAPTTRQGLNGPQDEYKADAQRMQRLPPLRRQRSCSRPSQVAPRQLLKEVYVHRHEEVLVRAVALRLRGEIQVVGADGQELLRGEVLEIGLGRADIALMANLELEPITKQPPEKGSRRRHHQLGAIRPSGKLGQGHIAARAGGQHLAQPQEAHLQNALLRHVLQLPAGPRVRAGAATIDSQGVGANPCWGGLAGHGPEVLG